MDVVHHEFSHHHLIGNGVGDCGIGGGGGGYDGWGYHLSIIMVDASLGEFGMVYGIGGEYR
jgi:hypothetical protein